MALTTRTLPALMNGISRQPAILRSPDQTEDELNTWGNIATGLARRPPTQTVRKLTGLTLGDATIHHINRDISERYLVLIDTDGIRVFDEATGDEKTVNTPLGLGYLNPAVERVSNGSFDGSTTGWTASNATLSIVSGALRVTNSAASYGFAYQAIAGLTIGTPYTLTVTHGASSNTFLMSIDGAIGGLTLSTSGTTLTFTATATTMYVNLWAGNNVSGAYSEYDSVSVREAGRVGSFRAVTIADYTFIVNTATTVALKSVGADQATPDTHLRFPGGNAVRNTITALAYVMAGQVGQYRPNPAYTGGLTGTVASMDKLPTTVCSGCVYKVMGDANTSFVSYYVMGDGTVWNETVEPGLQNALDETTMPHVLIREADGTFTFAPFSWQPRRVGDTDSNPHPPFVNRTIRDVFFYQNRLAFLSDESVIFSAAGDYGDFYRRTVLDYIDSDALAASATTTDVAILDYAVPFADGVMLFSRQRQLSLTNGDSGLSAHSLAIQPVTKYVMAPEVRPDPLGSQVHFVTDGIGHASVQEYTRLAGADPTEAADITAHVPGLIPEGVSQIVSAPDLDALFLLVKNASDPDDQKKMYVYQFFWDGDKKLQSAWRVWDFGDGTPLSAAYLDASLHLLVERPDGLFLEKIELPPNVVSDNQDHRIYLDRQETITGVYNSGTDTTTFTLVGTPDATKVNLVRGIGSAAPESVINAVNYVVSGNTVTVPGDESAAPVTIGHLYTTSMQLSQQFPVDYQGNKMTTGRLQLHTFTVRLDETAYTRAVVYPYGLAAAGQDPGLVFAEEFTGKLLGSAENLLGQRVYQTTSFTFSVAGNSKEAVIELVNDSPFASTWTSAEWEGLYFSRAL